MIDKDTAIEVTQELTRRCYPDGDTRVDIYRYESLLMKIAVASSLIDEIHEAGELYDRHEYSIQRISNRANQYLTELRDMLCEIEYLPPMEEIEDSEGCKKKKSKLESNDTVSKAVFEQIKWERDVALKTLEEHGIGLGERKAETVDTPTDTPTNAPTEDCISRQAAINAIENTDIEITAEEWDELTNAIESLSSAQLKPVCEDIISRQEAIKAIEEKFFAGTVADINPSWRLLHDIIKSLPPANTDLSDYIDRLWKIAYERGKSERPKGEWIRNNNGTCSCSLCQSWIPEEQHYYARFCLHCGASMEATND